MCTKFVFESSRFRFRDLPLCDETGGVIHWFRYVLRIDPVFHKHGQEFLWLPNDEPASQIGGVNIVRIWGWDCCGSSCSGSSCSGSSGGCFGFLKMGNSYTRMRVQWIRGTKSYAIFILRMRFLNHTCASELTHALS